MKFHGTTLPALLLAALSGLFCIHARAADPFPARPVRFIVANSPGSVIDIIARKVGPRLTEAFKQPVVVENRPAAGGITAADNVAKSAPDGYNLLLTANGPITILPSLHAQMPFDPRRDLVPVVSLGETDFILVANPKTGFRALDDFVKAARANPGRYNYASAGNGSPHHFITEQFKQTAGIYLTHIPYRGGPVGLADVIAGNVDVMFVAVAPALAAVQSGRVVVLAAGSEERLPILPDVPTINATYPGFTASTWQGIFAPAGTPRAVIEVLQTEVRQALADPALRTELANVGIRVTNETQAQFQARVGDEQRKFNRLVVTAGIKGD